MICESIKEEMAAQALRFSPRRPGAVTAACVSAAAAQLRFAKYVCLSADVLDANAFHSKSVLSALSSEPILAKQVSEVESAPLLSVTVDSKVSVPLIKTAINVHAKQSTPNKIQSLESLVQVVPATEKQSELIVYTVTPFAKALASKSLGCKTIYRAFKLGTPGHIAIALWNTETDWLEVFDPSGISTDTVLQQKLVEQLWPSELTRPKVSYVNTISLQTDPHDKFCATWIYIYLDLRVIQQKTVKQTLAFLHSLNLNQRFTMAASYWDTLIKSGGRSVAKPLLVYRVG